MWSWAGAQLRRWRAKPWHALAWLLALMTSMYVVGAPFALARYPMMTDLPFHAANASVFAHYGDADYHFRDQFVLQPLAVPYLTHYLLAAAFMPFTSALNAIKLASVLLLCALPLGLGVLAFGMRKSPLLGLAGLLLVWCQLTSWGFINFVAALGMFAMALGAALRILDRPSRGWQALLGGVLVVLLATHPFRFPFALLAIVLAAVVMYPVTRRWRQLLWPSAPAVALFGLWWLTKPAFLDVSWGPLAIHWERVAQAPSFLYASAHDAQLQGALGLSWALVAALALGLWVAGRAEVAGPRVADGFSRRAHALVLLCALGFALGYLVLPMEVSTWWYIYPREASACAFISLALLPDLPKRGWPKALAASLLAAASLPLARVTLDNYRHFDEQTAPFARIQRHIPSAPKLLYLIFDHSGSRAQSTPFIHLPAYVQAERGGWLSFHFASMGGSPLRYRDDQAALVPPAVPRRWEWTPQRFNMARDGAFFDWFLIRRRTDPAPLLRGGGQLELVAHDERWWLYRRIGGDRP